MLREPSPDPGKCLRAQCHREGNSAPGFKASALCVTVDCGHKANGWVVPASFLTSLIKSAVLASYLAVLSEETLVSLRDG